MAKKMSKHEAKRLAVKAGIDFSKDYHQLRSSAVDYLDGLRRLVGYRKPITASGSTTRYFFYYLKKVR